MSTHRNLLTAVICLVAGLSLCGAARAQLQTIPDDSTQDSSYAGEPPSASGANVELGSRVARDSNVFQNNAYQASDFIFQESAVVNLWKSNPRWNLGLQYRPTVLSYVQHSALNTVDQGLKFDGTYNFTQRLRFQGNETFDSTTGLIEPSSNEYFSLPISAFPSSNSTVVAPVAHELSNDSEGHILYDVSQRGSFDFMGSYEIQDFNAVKNAQAGPVTLFNTNGAEAGAAYQYRWSQRLTIGAKYLYQFFHFGLGGSDETHNAFLTANWQAASHVDLNLYGGPAYSTTIGASSLSPIVNERTGTLRTLSPALGGSLSFRSDRTLFTVSGQHLINNGGGLLMTVTSSSEGVELRHQLSDNWDFLVMATNAESDALQGETGKGSVDGQSFGTAFEHPVFEKLTVHLEYEYLRQRVNEFVPLGTNVNMGEFSIALFYRIGEPRL